MIAYLLLVIFASQLLGIDVSLAPGLSFKNAILYLTFIILALETVVARRRQLENLPVLVPFFLFALYAVLSWIVVLSILDYQGYDLLDSLIALKGGPIEEFLVLLIFFYGLTDQQRALWVLRRIVWLVIVANIFTVIDSLDVPDLGYMALDDGRVAGYTGNATTFGALLVCFLPAVIVLFRTTTGAAKAFAGIGVFATCLALVLTVSRSAFLGLLVAGLFGSYYLRARISANVVVRSAIVAFILGIVVFLGVILAGFGEIFLERFGRIGSNTFDATSGRNVIWSRAFTQMLANPTTFITGFGWFAYEASDYFTLNTHNTYLTFLYNLGVIGVTAYLIMALNVIRTLRSALSRATGECRMWIIAAVFGFSGLLVSVFFLNFASWLFVWAYIGLTLRIANTVADT